MSEWLFTLWTLGFTVCGWILRGFWDGTNE